MKKPIGMGIVGAGAIGLRGALSHLSVPDVHDRIKPTAVCDPVPGRAKAAAEKYGVPNWYETYEELLADSKVDAVTLCSPIGLHYEQGLAAVEAGKHVHFNKTMATRAAECDEMIARAAEKGVKLVASPGMMAHPHNQRIKERVRAGEIGQIIWAAAGVEISTYHLEEEFRTGEDILTDVDPSWYFKRPGGGPLYDVTVYSLHTLTGIMGPAKAVTGLSGLVVKEREYHGKRIECEMDDSTFMLLDYGNSVFALVYGTVAGMVTKGFHPSIFGLNGSVVGGKINDQPTQQEGDHQPHVLGEHAKLAESHVFEDMMQLVDWVLDGTPPIASAEHARHVVEIFEAAYRSAETGQRQALRTTFAYP